MEKGEVPVDGCESNQDVPRTFVGIYATVTQIGLVNAVT